MRRDAGRCPTPGRLYVDENVPLQVVEAMRSLGRDVLTMYEDGKANQSIPDDEVLELAVKSDRAILTMNRKHFMRLHHRRPDHKGIIVYTFDPDFVGQARRIVKGSREIPDLLGQLVRVYRSA